MRWWKRKKRTVSTEELEKAQRATRNKGSRLFSNQKGTPGGQIGTGPPDEPPRLA
jgi:hypothetical protein